MNDSRHCWEDEGLKFRASKTAVEPLQPTTADPRTIGARAGREILRQFDQLNALGRENTGLKVENAALEEENRMYRAQCAAQQQALLRFVQWHEEGLPEEPERREWAAEAKDLLAHPTGQLAVQWFRAEKAGLARDLRQAVQTGEEQAEKIAKLEETISLGAGSVAGWCRERAAVAEAANDAAAKLGFTDRLPPVAATKRLAEAARRFARLDALLGSEEPPEGLRHAICGQTKPCVGHHAEAAAAWRWFREALGTEVEIAPQIREEKSKGEADFDAVISEYLMWSLRTFPQSTPSSVAAHLRKEVAELEMNPESVEELADIVMLCFHSAARQGHDLTAAIAAKLAMLKTRAWKEPDADGVVEHVREPWIVGGEQIAPGVTGPGSEGAETVVTHTPASAAHQCEATNPLLGQRCEREAGHSGYHRALELGPAGARVISWEPPPPAAVEECPAFLPGDPSVCPRDNCEDCPISPEGVQAVAPIPTIKDVLEEIEKEGVCVCGHPRAAHAPFKGVLTCIIPNCACGPGCIHEGFVDRDTGDSPRARPLYSRGSRGGHERRTQVNDKFRDPEGWLERLSTEIADRERLIDALEEPPLGTRRALAHARKEWGHAASIEDDPEARSYYFRIVDRDLRVFDELMADASPSLGEGGSRSGEGNDQKEDL